MSNKKLSPSDLKILLLRPLNIELTLEKWYNDIVSRVITKCLIKIITKRSQDIKKESSGSNSYTWNKQEISIYYLWVF